MPDRNARKPSNPQDPKPTGIETLNEATRRHFHTVLELADWIGRQLELHLSPHDHPKAVLVDNYCKALRWRLAPVVQTGGQIDTDALAGYGVEPISLMSALSRDRLGDDVLTAASRLWGLLDQLPAAVWTHWQPPTTSIADEWQKATEMLRGCLASRLAGIPDDFADVEGLPAEIASILKRGDFPTLVNDEYAKLGAWLTANGRKHYDGMDTANVAKTRRMEEAKTRLRAILEYNMGLRRGASPAVPVATTAEAVGGQVAAPNGGKEGRGPRKMWSQQHCPSAENAKLSSSP